MQTCGIIIKVTLTLIQVVSSLLNTFYCGFGIFPVKYYLPILLEACGEEFVFIYRQLQRMIFQEVRLEIVKTVFLRESIPDKIFFLLRIWYSLNVCVCFFNSFSVSSDQCIQYKVTINIPSADNTMMHQSGMPPSKVARRIHQLYHGQLTGLFYLQKELTNMIMAFVRPHKVHRHGVVVSSFFGHRNVICADA